MHEGKVLKSNIFEINILLGWRNINEGLTKAFEDGEFTLGQRFPRI